MDNVIYDYSAMKPELMTDEGQQTFLKVREMTLACLSAAGAVRLDFAIKGSTGDSWLLVACVDRLVELGELKEVTQGQQVFLQHRVFVRGRP